MPLPQANFIRLKSLTTKGKKGGEAEVGGERGEVSRKKRGGGEGENSAGRKGGEKASATVECNPHAQRPGGTLGQKGGGTKLENTIV